MRRQNVFDVAIIGGGFYGCMLALFLKRQANKIVVVEREEDLLMRASYNNQARVHNGYHYPRSFLTALRSHMNYARFASDFKASLVDECTMYYAIASGLSKTTAWRFVKFCEQIGARVNPAPEKIKLLFNPRLIEDVFGVEEFIFNAATVRRLLRNRLAKHKIKVLCGSEVIKVGRDSGRLLLFIKNGRKIEAKRVFNCTYSGINTLLRKSHLPTLPFKHEFTEMPLVRVPEELKNIGITIMDGPFFGVLPFPDKKLHTIHHVRYTPHTAWADDVDRDAPVLRKLRKISRFPFMIKDAQRYIPILKEAEYKGSLYEVKTVLQSTETSDGRPILFRKNHGLKNFHVVMGGKIDNIYDILAEVKHLS